MYKKIAHVMVPSWVLVVSVLCALLVGWYLGTQTFYKKALVERGVASLGTEIGSEMATLRVESVRKDDIGVLPYTPQKGYVFIIPTLIIGNPTEKSLSLIPSVSLHIKDRDGNIYHATPASVEGDQFSGPIVPHDKVRQEVAFEVKESAKDLVLYFEVEGKILMERLEK